MLLIVTGRGVREREAEGLPRPKEKNSRCRSFGEAWATENLGFIGREENRAGRTELPRASASERRGSVPRSETRLSQEQGSKRLARTESGSGVL